MGMDSNQGGDGKTVSKLFMILTTGYVVCLVVSNTIAGKLCLIAGNFSADAGTILFPVTYILGDVFTEVYGFKRARTVIWLGFSFNFIAVALYMLTVALPYPDFWTNQEAYAVVMGSTPRLTAASLAGYLFGEFSNSMILSKLKVWCRGKMLWVRTILSTVVGECLDTAIFVALAFGGTQETSVLFGIFAFEYVFKVCFEIVCTPATYAVVGWLKRAEGVDTFDYNETYRVI